MKVMGSIEENISLWMFVFHILQIFIVCLFLNTSTGTPTFFNVLYDVYKWNKMLFVQNLLINAHAHTVVGRSLV